MENVSISEFGPQALLVRFAESVDASSLARCRGLLRALDQACLDGIRDLTPAYCSLLLEFEHPEQVANQLGDLKEVIKSAKAWPAEEAPLHAIRVCYDGADIEEFARCVRLSVSNVIALHTAPIYSVFVIGFSPGFPYLGPLDPRLHAPRLSSPRTRVGAGSVAIGGEHTGIYTIASPGGWWLIGRTDSEVFCRAKASDAGSGEAFLLRQGDRVKFHAVTTLGTQAKK